jgi:hypothetical protein
MTGYGIFNGDHVIADTQPDQLTQGIPAIVLINSHSTLKIVWQIEDRYALHGLASPGSPQPPLTLIPIESNPQIWPIIAQHRNYHQQEVDKK